VGITDGLNDGHKVGDHEGMAVGIKDGELEIEGRNVGEPVGTLVGTNEGVDGFLVDAVGCIVGDFEIVGFNDLLGAIVGEKLGLAAVGIDVDGLKVGAQVDGL